MIVQEDVPYTKEEVKAMVKTIHDLREKVNQLGWHPASESPPEEGEYWQHYRIQASIAAMQIVADKNRSVRDQHEQHLIAIYSVELADTLIAELQKKQD